MVIGKSWADEVEEELEEAEKLHELEQSKAAATPSPSLAPSTAPKHDPPASSHFTSADASDSWRRKDARATPPPFSSGSTPRGGGSGAGPPSQPKAILVHNAPPYPRTSGAGGAPDLPITFEHGRPTSSSGVAAVAGPSITNNAAASGLPPGLQDAVTAAYQEIMQPYCKAMVQILHQLMTAIPTQLPKAVAAACSNAKVAGGQVNISTAELQKGLLISLAPLQEQVAQLQKALAHVVPNQLPAQASTSIYNGGGSASPSQPRNPPPAPPNHLQQNNRRPSPTPVHSTHPPTSASPAPASAGGNKDGLSFVERMKLAAEEKRAAERLAGTSPLPGHASGPEDDDDYAHKPSRHHKVKTGYQAYQPPVRRAE